MKRSLPIILSAMALIAMLLASSENALARSLRQGGAPAVVSYQGQVRVGGQPYSGTGYFKFAVVDAGGTTNYWSNDGTSTGEPSQAVQLIVTNGLFTVLLGDTSLGGMTRPLAATVFSGTERYLRVWFSADGTSYTLLTPDRRIAAVPYALQAEEAIHAGQADNATHAQEAVHAQQAPWSGLSGVPDGFSDGVDNDTLAGLACSDGQSPQWNGSAWVCANGVDTTTLWSLAGNSGTTPGTDFIGTTDNQALELKVNNGRALRMEPHATSPNLIGGHSANQVRSGVYGATIGGGGESGYGNLVTDKYGTIGGGANNLAGDSLGTTDDAGYATVAGGFDNKAYDMYSTVGGGASNQAANTAATIGGGANNYAGGVGSTIGGGAQNDASGSIATIGGGQNNVASGNYATVPGGLHAAARHHGELAYASGGFNDTPGTAQTSVYVLRGMTVGNQAKELWLDGQGQRITLESGRTMILDILIVGREESNGESAGYHIRTLVENVDGTVRFSGSILLETLAEDDSEWSVGLAPGHYDDISILVMGNQGDIVRWVATVRTVEVQW